MSQDKLQYIRDATVDQTRHRSAGIVTSAANKSFNFFFFCCLRGCENMFIDVGYVRLSWLTCWYMHSNLSLNYLV